ncbi:MAG: hypothetical protein R3A50_04410 [Saprospiraceae bacterium]|nr:hypothetical protein [Saprospiraceae bacterium]MCB9342636.1 hypothetical protein [Lewinellaceae bacterium]
MTKPEKYPKVLDENHKRTVEIYLEKIGEPLPDWSALDEQQTAKMVRTYHEIVAHGQGDPLKAAAKKLDVREFIEGVGYEIKKDFAENREKYDKKWDEVLTQCDREFLEEHYPEFAEGAQKIIDDYWEKYYPGKPQKLEGFRIYHIRGMLYSESQEKRLPDNERDDWIKCCLNLPNETYGLYPGKKTAAS